MPLRSLALRTLGFVCVVGALAGGAYVGGERWIEGQLPTEGHVAEGVRVGAARADGHTSAEALVAREAARLLDARVTLELEGAPVLEASLRELGATVPEASAARAAHAVGRRGSIEGRVLEARRAREGELQVVVRPHVPLEPLAERLARLKEERDVRARGARFDFATGRATEHVEGRVIDVPGTLAALDLAIADLVRGAPTSLRLPLVLRATEPRASRAVVDATPRGETLARYATRFAFVGGRGKNVARAASRIDGVVLMPGEAVSFNEHVGPRTPENGFFEAPEIYKGEMRQGIGGGTCQVASTLHAAAFFAGLDVVSRANHSRPSGYIPPGLDATVVYPEVDLRLRNPFDFPVIVRAQVDRSGLLEVSLLGQGRPATVSLATETVGLFEVKRKAEEVAWLPAGELKLKQKGVRGMSIKKTRTIARAGEQRVEVSVDVYPGAPEIFLVPRGGKLEELLPPPGAEGEAASASRG